MAERNALTNALAGPPYEGFYGDTWAPPSTETSRDRLTNALASVGQKYPILGSHLKESVVGYGTPTGPTDDRQLEFYHPWDSHNPNPGKNTIEVFNRDLQGDDLHAAIAGDLLHRLGSIDPRTNQPVDPKFYDLRQQLGAARSPQHQRIDQEAYARDQASPYGAGAYPEWDQHSRLDAYVRGGLFPKQNPDWQNGAISPQMRPIIDQMHAYLTSRVPSFAAPQLRNHLGDVGEWP